MTFERTLLDWKILTARTTMRLTALLLVLAVIWPAPHALAQPAGLPETVKQALARTKLPEASVAVYVHEIGAPRPAVAFGAERVMNPASTMNEKSGVLASARRLKRVSPAPLARLAPAATSPPQTTWRRDQC